MPGRFAPALPGQFRAELPQTHCLANPRRILVGQALYAPPR